MTSGSSLLAPRADWVRVLEAIYAAEGADETWARSIGQAMLSVFHRSAGIGVLAVDHDRERRSVSLAVAASIGDAPIASGAQFRAAGPKMFDALFYPRFLAGTQTEIVRRSDAETRRFLCELQQSIGFSDALGILAYPEPDCVVVASVPLHERRMLTKHEKRLLSRIALHLESGYRLRRRPEHVHAVLSPDGRIVHRESAEFDADTLSHRVKAIDRSRLRTARRETTAIDVWEALVSGEASIVERLDGAKRWYLVLENAPSRRTHRTLTRREVDVTRMAARGVPVKLIAYGLGISSAAASNALAQAATKLGLKSRLDLVRVAALLLDTPGAPVEPTSLTRTERDVFELVRSGLSNEEIARRRSRSVRTVANQVAAILRKTESATRRAIVSARVARS